MSTTLVNPAGLAEVPIYKHVSVSTGSRRVFVAGQIARDAGGGQLPVPPLTGIGVAALAEPDVLVELQAVAVLA